MNSALPTIDATKRRLRTRLRSCKSLGQRIQALFPLRSDGRRSSCGCLDEESEDVRQVAGANTGRYQRGVKATLSGIC